MYELLKFERLFDGRANSKTLTRTTGPKHHLLDSKNHSTIIFPFPSSPRLNFWGYIRFPCRVDYVFLDFP